jgi:hypothetical protein
MVPVSYMVMRMFYDKYTGLLSAGIMASSSALIEFSTNARSYTIISLVFLILLAVLKYLKNKRNTAAWSFFVIFSSLGLYTTPVMVYPFLVAVIWFFLSMLLNDMNYSRRLILKDFLLSLFVIVCLTGIFYSPVIIGSGLNSIIGNDAVSGSKIISIRNLGLVSVGVWDLFNRDVPNFIYFVLIAGFFTSLLFHKKLSDDRISIFVAVVLLITLIMLFKIIPFPGWKRHWLFLLPIYIGIASSGVAFILKTIGTRIMLSKHFVFAFLSIIISLWLGINVVSSQSVYYSNDTGTLRDAEDITFYIKQKLKPDDRILANCPSDSPLLYYFNLHNVSSKFLFDSPATGGRIFIVVNLSAKQTLDRIIGGEKVVRNNYSTPELIKKYEFANLYLMNKIINEEEN